jgi:hypothetical protein
VPHQTPLHLLENDDENVESSRAPRARPWMQAAFGRLVYYKTIGILSATGGVSPEAASSSDSEKAVVEYFDGTALGYCDCDDCDLTNLFIVSCLL